MFSMNNITEVLCERIFLPDKLETTTFDIISKKMVLKYESIIYVLMGYSKRLPRFKKIGSISFT